MRGKARWQTRSGGLRRPRAPERVIWRYDPIFLSDAHTEAWHAERFGGLVDALRGCTEKVVISFLDMDYRTVRRMGQKELRGGTAESRTASRGR